MKNSVTRILFVRLLSSIVILFLLISSIFVLLRIAPGDPVQKFISPEFSNQLADKVRESFHLNGSILDQYLNFIKNLVSGDFGISYNYHSPVLSVIKDYLPFTLIFSFICFSTQIVNSTIPVKMAWKRRIEPCPRRYCWSTTSRTCWWR